MRLLARNGVIEPDLAEQMASAVEFRNVLVHRYADVDDRVVIEHLDRLDRLSAYLVVFEGAFGDSAEPS